MRRNVACGLSIALASACAFDLPEPRATENVATPAPDGGAEGADAGKITPAFEGGTPEAGAAACPAGALLCEDFDTQGISGWSLIATGGTAVLGPGRTGNGIVATVPARDGSSRLSAALEKSVTLPARTPFTIAFDLNVSAVTNVGIVDIRFFYLKPPYYELGLRFGDYGSHSFVHDYGDSVGGGATVGDDFAIEPVAAATWTRVAVAITYLTASTHAVVTYDGVTKWQEDVPADNYNATSKYISLGIGSTEHAGGEVTVLIDNVVMTSP